MIEDDYSNTCKELYMRIIAGKFRRQPLLSPPPSTRPTSDRARESLFNILMNLNDQFVIDAYILDAFAGSGALGLEALSRGATHVTFLENNHQAAGVLKANIAKLGVTSQCSLLMYNAMNPPKAPHAMQLVFLDPPYDQIVEDRCITALCNEGWINSKTLIVLETSAKRPLQLPVSATLIDQRRYGAALISFLTFTP
jgi:16S rRNA (guanine966-N2)-methyltransferase